MENLDFGKILEVLFPILAVVFGAYWIKAKTKLTSVAELLVTVNDALKDDKLSQEEMKAIVAGVMKVLGKEIPK